MAAVRAPLVLLLLAGTYISTLNAAPSDHPLSYDNFSLKDQKGNVVLELGVGLSDKDTSSSCKSGTDIECRSWGSKRSLKVSEDDDQCQLITWTAAESETLLDCFPLGDANWYGGPENIPQKWPLEKYSIDDKVYHAMVTQETGNRGITDPFWFNSQGLSIYVHPGMPLFMSINSIRENGLCLEAKIQAPYRARPKGFHLKYVVCKSSNPKEAFMNAVRKFLGKPSGYPDERMIRHPVWSTWAKYKAEISDEIVRDFANQITTNGFNNSQFEIDDSWETCYGSKIVDTTRFPNMKKLTDDLKSQGFRVTIWTHPFVQLDCTETLDNAKKSGYLVTDLNGNITMHWWNGWAGIIDFTKQEAAQWFIDEHRKAMTENGFDGYKFDAGETSWNPQLPKLSIEEDIDEEYPSLITKKYVNACATFGVISEVRSAYLTQNLPIFLRMIDKDSRWGINNGLKSLVTTLLQMNMVGYSNVLPDMIGGNQYNGEVATSELFIRWLQANTFMPALQFALVPWDYDDETIRISKIFTELHDKFTDKVIAAMKRNVEDGTPVNPPIWWIAPEDKMALKEDTEYLLGEDILVAPVLDEGATQRDIYLPAGTWEDGNTGEKHEGPKTIKNYQAKIDVLPYFIKSSATSLFASLLAVTLAPLVVLIS